MSQDAAQDTARDTARGNDIKRSYRETLERVPEFAQRLRGAKREAPLRGARLAGFFRKPYGPGWALVGDAAYHKDAITAQGIGDAFRDAERCADALDETFKGVRSFDQAMAEGQRVRDAHALPMYEFTSQLASMQPPSPEMQELIGALHGRQKAMDAFAQMYAGTISPATFFAPQNISALLAA